LLVNVPSLEMRSRWHGHGVGGQGYKAMLQQLGERYVLREVASNLEEAGIPRDKVNALLSRARRTLEKRWHGPTHQHLAAKTNPSPGDIVTVAPSLPATAELLRQSGRCVVVAVDKEDKVALLTPTHVPAPVPSVWVPIASLRTAPPAHLDRTISSSPLPPTGDILEAAAAAAGDAAASLAASLAGQLASCSHVPADQLASLAPAAARCAAASAWRRRLCGPPTGLWAHPATTTTSVVAPSPASSEDLEAVLETCRGLVDTDWAKPVASADVAAGQTIVLSLPDDTAAQGHVALVVFGPPPPDLRTDGPSVRVIDGDGWPSGMVLAQLPTAGGPGAGTPGPLALPPLVLPGRRCVVESPRHGPESLSVRLHSLPPCLLHLVSAIDAAADAAETSLTTEDVAAVASLVVSLCLAEAPPTAPVAATLMRSAARVVRRVAPTETEEVACLAESLAPDAVARLRSLVSAEAGRAHRELQQCIGDGKGAPPRRAVAQAAVDLAAAIAPDVSDVALTADTAPDTRLYAAAAKLAAAHARADTGDAMSTGDGESLSEAEAEAVVTVADMRGAGDPLTLGGLVSANLHLVSYDVRRRCLAAAVSSTAPRLPQEEASVVVSFGGGGETRRSSAFEQARGVLDETPGHMLMAADGVAFGVHEAADTGWTAAGDSGPFEGKMAEVAEELVGGCGGVLRPCTNADVGAADCDYKDTREVSTSSDFHTLRRLHFLGRLIGLALRRGAPFPLDLGPATLKYLVGRSPVRSDLAYVDATLLSRLTLADDEMSAGIAGQAVARVVEAYCRPDTAAPKAPSSLPPVDHTIDEKQRADWNVFVDQLVHWRLVGVSQKGLDAMRCGLAEVYPLPLLTLLTPPELDVALNGVREVDVGRVRRNTQVKPVTGAPALAARWQATVDMFWTAFEALSPELKVALVQFITGCRRLPANDKARPFPFELRCMTPLGDGEELRLPTASTCFSTLHLPLYSSAEVLAEKLSVAIRSKTPITEA